MKIKLADLKPNPYRKIDKYPINAEKVKALINSINETSFWDNIVCRERNGKYEIAYGHHRLEALRRIGQTEVDIPVRDIDDSTMIRIMANENMDEWQSNTSVMLETVLTAKEYLEGELAKYATWEDWKKDNKTNDLFSNHADFGQAKGKQGIGQIILNKFLGANWKQWQIQKALSILKESDIDLEAVTEIDNLQYADIAKDQLKKHGVKKEDQKDIVQSAKEKLESEQYESVKTGRTERGVPRKEEKFKAAMEEAIADKNYKSQKENFNKVFPKRSEKKDINVYAWGIVERFVDINTVLKEVLANWEYVTDENKVEIAKSAKRTYEIISNFKEAKSWKLISA
jgi:hypothetical protein